MLGVRVVRIKTEKPACFFLIDKIWLPDAPLYPSRLVNIAECGEAVPEVGA